MNYEIDETNKNEYESVLVEQEWLKALQEAEEDVKNNHVKPVKEVFIDIRSKLLQ